MTASVVDARKDRNRQHLALLARWCATVVALPALLVAVAVAVLARHVLLGVLAGFLVYAGVSALAYLHVRRYGSAFVAGLDGAEEDGDTASPPEARLHNLLDGLCLAHGVTRPRVLILPGESANAATVAITDRSHDVVLVVTRPVIDDLSRIELEGLLAQQLSHVRDGDTALSTFVAALASMPLLGGILGRRAGGALDPHLETSADLGGAALTRYPPGVAAALARLAERPTVIAGVAPESAHLWLADPLPEGVTEPFVPHPPLADRIEVLHEL